MTYFFKKRKMRATREGVLFALLAVLWMLLMSGCGDSRTSYALRVDDEQPNAEEMTDKEEPVRDADESESEGESEIAQGADSEQQNLADEESANAQGTDSERRNLEDEASANAEPSQIYVYVCGAVVSPGVYGLPADSRVYEAIRAAGGFTEDAEIRALNQAAPLFDGEQITVYTIEEASQGLVSIAAESLSGGTAGAGSSTGSTDGTSQAVAVKVNINTASVDALMTLPGIGESRAKSIISYREQNGNFQSIEEIQNISGIKSKAFEKIKDLITV